MEWLFLTCHNYWIVCRLVKDDEHPFLAYSPKISIEDSSVPFRAFLSAILSAFEGDAVEPSIFNPNMLLDTIAEDEDEDEGPLREDDIDDGSGAYTGSSSTGTADPPVTRGRENAQFGLMVCPPYSLNVMWLTHSLRLLPLPLTLLNPSKFGCISTPCRTIHLPFRSVPRTGNDAFG